MIEAKILIVEDKPFWVNKIEKLLKKAGYQLTDKVRSVKDAKASIERNMPDLAILDIELTDSDLGGIEVAKYIRENRLMVRIIFLTQWNDRSLQKLAVETRFNNYLTKNDSDETILLGVEMALRFPLEELYKSKIRKANGQVMYAGRNCLWIKGKTVEIAQISFIKSDRSRTYFHLHNGDRIIVTIHLGKIMKVIKHPHLMRIHNSYVINVNAIKRGVDSGYVFVADLSSKNNERGIAVSKKYTKKLLEKWLEFGQKT